MADVSYLISISGGDDPERGPANDDFSGAPKEAFRKLEDFVFAERAARGGAAVEDGEPANPQA